MTSKVSRRGLLVGAGTMATMAAMGIQLATAEDAYAAPGMSADEDGYDLWLRYQKVAEPSLGEYRRLLTEVVVADREDAVIGSARDELVPGLESLLDTTMPVVNTPSRDGAVVIGTPDSPLLRPLFEREQIGPESFVIRSTSVRGRRSTVIVGGTGRGVLYGVFAFLRRLQLQQSVDTLAIEETPRHRLRLVNHWDNLSGSGPMGIRSIFRWDELPSVRPRYTDYARVLASLGINGTVVNNVSNSLPFLGSDMVVRLGGLADVLRVHGIRPFLSASFVAPIGLGGLATADPLDPQVRQWWRDKVDEIYQVVPDFGGFLVKADSERDPGPESYGRTAADGANMLAEALRPHDGLVIWRTWVWDIESRSNPTRYDDVAFDGYDAFAHQDGDFAPNVVLQSKKGPDDFQLREPFHPLFGALPRTNSAMELQITQEYTGGTATLCYLVPSWKEILDSDTHAEGGGSEVAGVLDGSLHGYEWSGMAGVTNLGDDDNWTGHHLTALNMYGFGRLAWDSNLGADQIAEEWVRMTFGHDPEVVGTITAMVMASPRIFEDYTSPLGVGRTNLAGGGDLRTLPDLVGREWYHRSTEEGTGFDRTVATGSGFTDRYHGPVAGTFESLAGCPEEVLLYFHHVPYTHELQRLAPGKTVIQHIYDTHFDGADAVERELRAPWLTLADKVDARRHREVLERVDAQAELAVQWRDAVVWYFFGKSRILDERDRMGVRLDLATPVAMVAGRSNKVDLQLMNATHRDIELRVEVDPDGGWSSGTVTQGVRSADAAVFPIEITAPTDAVPAETELTVLAAEVDGQMEERATIGVLTTVPADQAVLALDAGTATSPVLDGYQRLSPLEVWDEARGFGWMADPGVTPGNDGLMPTDDAYVRGGASDADENFGSDLDLVIKTHATNASLNRQIYLAFDLSDVEVDDGDRAALFLYGNGTSADYPIDVRRVLDTDWDEQTITWNDRPEPQDRVSASFEYRAAGWYEVDLTDLVVEALSEGAQRLAVVLSASEQRDPTAAFVSKEHEGNLGPRLVVGPPSDGDGSDLPPPPDARDRGEPGVLLRDFVQAVDEKVLRIAVPPGPHRGYVLAGDQSTGWGATVVSSDGEVLAEVGTQARGLFRWLAFDLDGEATGRTVDLHFSGNGSQSWRLNAFVLQSEASPA